METRSNHILVGGVVLALLAALVAFIIWLAGLGGGATKEYDIFFRQSVEGLAKGSSVSFAGVPSGQIKEISLWKANPEFVRVRISVDDDLPILIGTSASVQGVGFTGVSQIQLTGAVKGAPPITELGPGGVPTIPTKAGGLGALLNNAPQLVERLSTLTERLTELLSDENQTYFSGILKNVDRASGALADSGPELKATIAQTRIAVREAGQAAQSISALASTTDALMTDEGRPMIADLRKTVRAAEISMTNLDAALKDARPGIKALSTQTIPEVGQLVRDLRAMSDSLGAVANKIDQQGAGALIGGPALPDYKPGKGGK
jgi:phospholipid/cholesterol/gamma-HCH transport system substrate-binding protein